MSDAPHPLEAELAALRPRQPSPELRRRVAEWLAKPASRPFLLWTFAVAGALTAAALVAAVLLWPKHEGNGKPAPAPAPPTPPAAESDESSPTLQAYRQALTRSPEDLDALLARHAATSHPNGRSAKTYAFDRSVYASMGEP